MSTREAFEMWFKTENGFHTDTDLLKHDDKYVYAPAKIAWNVWQACQSHNDTVIAELVEAHAETIMQILTDPENQPSQFGTVPLKWYENLDNKLEKIRFNVGEVIDSLHGSYEKHAIRKKLQEAIDQARKI